MKLKPIPQNTVVHTPIEEEAKELLAILHEGGYRWYASNNDEKGWQGYQDQTCYRIDSKNGVYHKCDKLWYETICQYCILPVLTLAEFKERYSNLPKSEGLKKESTEDMETKELNLMELLRGHEGESFYSTISGDVKINDFCGGVMKPIGTTSGRYCSDGKYQSGGVVCLFPSRALYEQYPLDPYTAWMKWQEEQKKHWVSVTVWIDDIECESDTAIDTDKIYFRTPSDRDKCIEEIKAIIEKYSK